MHLPVTRPLCRLECLWAGTDHCLACQVDAGLMAARHLSLGVQCGLKAYYDPLPLPPCVEANGDLRWETAANPSTREWGQE